eukprot:10763963-Prorocentrum_lima.AAC.1
MGKHTKAVQNVLAEDKDGEEVTELWHKYNRLMSRINLFGLGHQVPPPIGVLQINIQEDGRHLVIDATSLELMDTAGSVARALRGLESHADPGPTTHCSGA